MLSCQSLHIQFQDLLEDICATHNNHVGKLYRYFLFCLEMGFAIFLSILVSMCMLRPEEEENEEGLYDDVGTNLEPAKER